MFEKIKIESFIPVFLFFIILDGSLGILDTIYETVIYRNIGHIYPAIPVLGAIFAIFIAVFSIIIMVLSVLALHYFIKKKLDNKLSSLFADRSLRSGSGY